MVRSVGQEAVRKAWRLQREGKSQDEIALAINRSLRQTSRYLSRKWLKERNLEHLAYSEPAMSYLEREAKGRCERGDHSFMEDRRFEGQLYTMRVDKTASGTNRTTREVKTCIFCRHEKPGRRSFASVNVAN